MPLPNDIVVTNQFGETSICEINTVAAAGAAKIVTAAAPAQVTGKLLTGLPVGAATTILAADTILQALAKLQAQIDAL